MRSIIGLLPKGIERTEGYVRVGTRETTAFESAKIARGSEVAMVFQDALTALDPLMRVGQQLHEVRRTHFSAETKKVRTEKIIELLAEVGIDDPERCMRSYVHQLSGGLRQRCLIALALAAEPLILLCDEPTTALDVVVQNQIIRLLERLSANRGVTIVFVSHDLRLVADFCERIIVMYDGEIVESGPTATVLNTPRHPYVQALKRALPDPDVRYPTLEGIPGVPPNLQVHRSGCSFKERCRYAEESCQVGTVTLQEFEDTRLVRCLFPLTYSNADIGISKGENI